MRFLLHVCLTATLALSLTGAPRKKGRTASRHRTTEVLSAEAINNPAWTSAETRAAMLRAQVLLARARFSPGEIDGQKGDNYRRALSGFQAAHNLPVTGTLGEATWTALNSDPGPVLITYTINPADVAGPFMKIPTDMAEKAKLPALGYESPQEALAERFHISTAILSQLNPGASFAAGDRITVPDTGTAPQGKAAKIVITKAGTLTAYNNTGGVIAQYPCSSGSEHDPLPIGEWKVVGIARNPPFFYNPDLFWDARPNEAKAKIPSGPNNPVGVVWIDLSKEHYGIHGTPNPATVGHAQSHGCIRLTNWDAAELASMVSRNTPVICQE